MKRPTTLARYFASILGVVCVAAGAQELPTILLVDTENWVNYGNPVIDPLQLARNPAIVTATPSLNFGTAIILADVTAVNGNLVKGVFISQFQQLQLTPTPNPGQAISDVLRAGVIRSTIEILHPDGRQIGAIFTEGLNVGTPAPGSPLGSIRDSIAITGGTGAFLGAKGTMNTVEASGRVSSQVEDPSMRRVHGGGRQRYVLQIFPMFRPEVLVSAAGPVIIHADYSAITSDKPARPGEILILYAKGLGPTTPSVNPGDPYPSQPFAIVTSPVEVLVNGKPSPAINQIGLPGSSDTYHVAFRVPDGTAAGAARVQISTAWVTGAAVPIPVR